jgi:hypothetical protein
MSEDGENIRRPKPKGLKLLATSSWQLIPFRFAFLPPDDTTLSKVFDEEWLIA